MLIYFGDINKVNAASINSFILNNSIYKTADPICLSFLQEDAPSLLATAPQVIDMIHMLDTLRKGVYMRVALYPGNIRVSVTTALIDAQAQIDSIYSIFLSYGLTNYLKGIVIDNVSLNTVYADNSQLSRSNVNFLVDYIHNTYQIGVACMCNFGEDVVSIFTPPEPRVTITDSSVILPVSDVNIDVAYTDWIIHLDPFLLVWNNGAVIQPDLSKVAAILQMMKVLNYNQAIAQSLPLQGYAFSGSFLLQSLGWYIFDNAANVNLDPVTLQSVQNMSLFLETLGITTYAICGDTDYGKLSNLHIDEGVYKPLAALNIQAPTAPNAYGLNYTYFDSDATSVYVRANISGVVSLLATFSLTLQLVNPPAITQII